MSAISSSGAKSMDAVSAPSPTPQDNAGLPEKLVSSSSLHFVLLEMVRIVEQTAVAPMPLHFDKNDSEHPVAAVVDREAVYYKLELLGFDVGQRFVERMVRDHSRFQGTLDVVKFICKEFWSTIFQRQIDNLKTNHRGVYVLQDNAFAWFMKASSNLTPDETTRQMAAYLWFPCGILRGALAGLGYAAVVMAESVGLPQCTFQIKIANG